MIKRYIFNIFIGVDQLFNAIFGGDPEETISSRLGRYSSTNKAAYYIAKVIDYVALKIFKEANHCKVSLEPPDHHRNDILK